MPAPRRNGAHRAAPPRTVLPRTVLPTRRPDALTDAAWASSTEVLRQVLDGLRGMSDGAGAGTATVRLRRGVAARWGAVDWFVVGAEATTALVAGLVVVVLMLLLTLALLSA